MYLFLCVFLFKKTKVHIPVQFLLVKGLNRELTRGLAHYQQALLVFTASRWVDLIPHNHSELENKHGCTGPRKGAISSEKTHRVLWLNSTFLLVCCNDVG